jgi:hypothetical protein
MPMNRTAAGLLIGLMALVLACGGYSAPNGSAPQDSTSDSTPRPSTPPPGYSRN